MGQAVYGRILLKLSGESLAGDGASIDWSAFEPIGRQIAQIRRMGVGIGIVIGGGNIYRGRMGTFSRETGDRMGMLATEINGLALREFLGRLDVPCQLRSSLFPRGGEFGEARRAMDEGQTIIFSGGTGLPYFSTDTAAALRALEIGASVILKASTVDGIYDRDPRRDPAAKQFRRLTYDEAIRRRLDDVLDGEAFCLCRTHGIGLVIFNVRRPDALLGAVRGEEVGTLVTEGGTTE
jgi:uridylate kinase